MSWVDFVCLFTWVDFVLGRFCTGRFCAGIFCVWVDFVPGRLWAVIQKNTSSCFWNLCFLHIAPEPLGLQKSYLHPCLMSINDLISIICLIFYRKHVLLTMVLAFCLGSIVSLYPLSALVYCNLKDSIIIKGWIR